MRKALKIKAEAILKEHKFKRRWARTVVGLSVVVVMCMSYVLILPAITMTDETFCGYEQHTEHDEAECYTEIRTLVCDLSEDGHIHSDACYERQQKLLCGIEESDGHVHTEECADENGDLICGLADGEGAHRHDEACYATETVLICGLDDHEPHVHDDSCYVIEKELTCSLPLHEHTLQCYSNPDADVESQSVWERAVGGVSLTGNWNEDVIAIAKTQIGYSESERNYLVEEDGSTRKGYTRYGAWYGDPYGDWCAMFCSFCLHYAQVPTSAMPRSGGCQSWITDLVNVGLYHSAGSDFIPRSGDLIFFDHDGDGEADHVGFVYETNEINIKTIEGNKADRVKYDIYAANDSSIVGYGELPENPGLPTQENPAEDTTSEENATEEKGSEGTTIAATAEDGAAVTVQGNLPDDAEVTIVPVVLDQAQLSAYLGESGSVSVQSYVVYDITIWSNGTEWQPDEAVSITISKPDIEIKNDEHFAVAHVADDGHTSEVEANLTEDGNIAFTADGFSLYIIYTYTVDFHYSDYTYSIRGGSSILLSELFEALGIDADMNSVLDVQFSNGSLIRIEKVTRLDGLPDWKLLSLSAFDTDEELTITLEGNEILTVHVTDASGASTPLSPAEAPDYIGTYPTGSGSTEWQITKEQYTGRTQNEKTPVDADGDGEADLYLQKNIVPTNIENEFLVYLSVDKKMTWEEFLNNSRFALTTANYSGAPLGEVYSSLIGNATAELSEHNNPGTYSNRYYIRFDVYQDHSASTPLYRYYDRRYGTTSNCNNATAFLKIPGVGYMVIAQGVNLRGEGRNQSNPFVLSVYLDSLSSDLPFYDTVFNEVTDVLGDNIEFMDFVAQDGTATYDEANRTIIWKPEDNPAVIPDVDYNPLSAWNENVIQLVYRVRLNVEASGFSSCADTISDKEASIAANESFAVNTSAELDYDMVALPETVAAPNLSDLTAAFPAPEVRGLRYNIALIKQNEDGEPLEGAVFGLYEADGTTPITRDGEDLTFTTTSNGVSRFTDLPSGDYVLRELTPPTGYTLSSPSRWRIHPCYTASPADLVQDESPYEHNMRYSGNDTNGQWIVKNSNDPVPYPDFNPGTPPDTYVPHLKPGLTKQIDYLGDNDGKTDGDNLDTTLDDNGVKGLEDLYRLYLNLQGDSEGVDLVLVMDASDSMFTNPMGSSPTRADVLLDFLNGTNGETGFIADFLAANDDNRIAAVSFGNEATVIHGWTQTATPITLSSSGYTNYTAGLSVADALLHDPALAGSRNQKLVIFLGDGSVTVAYTDGQLQNGNPFGRALDAFGGSLYRELVGMITQINGGTLVNPNDAYIKRSGIGGYSERFYLYEQEQGSTPASRAVHRNLRDLNLDIPGFTNGVGITDMEAFQAFRTELMSLSFQDDAAKLAFIDRYARASRPTRNFDLYTLTKIAFLEFMEANPDVAVHSIGFSSEIDEKKEDLLGNLRNESEVLEFFAAFGGGKYHYAETAQALAKEIYSICFMTETQIEDTLSAYVQVSDYPELKVAQTDTDGKNEIVLYENGALTTAGTEILESVSLDTASGELTVKFRTEYPISPEHIYTASFNVKVAPNAYTYYVENGYSDTGDPNTDYGTNTTSSGMLGFFSNSKGKVTWEAGGHKDNKSYDKPVIQVYEGFLYELPSTGGGGTFLYTLGGLGLMIGALMYGCKRRKRKVVH